MIKSKYSLLDWNFWHSIIYTHFKAIVMKNKLFILATALVYSFSGYAQDSSRTISDKPGTPQSLRKTTQTPENHVQVITPNATPNQADINRPSESNTPNNSTQQTITTDPNAAPASNPANSNTLKNVPPENMRTPTNSSAIQNGISNANKPLRNK